MNHQRHTMPGRQPQNQHRAEPGHRRHLRQPHHRLPVDSPGSADLIADFEGYHSPAAASKVRAVALPSGYYIEVSMAYAFDVPVSALTAGLYNVTVTQPLGHGFVTVYPDGLTDVPTSPTSTTAKARPSPTPSWPR